jgi:hypothetical protein
MKIKTILKTLFIICFISGIISCKDKTEDKLEIVEKEKTERKTDTIEKEKSKIITVYNFDNQQELSAYNKLNLDATHPNLLNPNMSNSDYDMVMKSWTDLHQRIGAYLSENKFNWEVKDKSISIVHKIYFKSNGEIENYFFNILNENVTKEKKEQFAKLISTFAKANQIEFKKDEKFAQCGKTKYMNR